MAQEIGGEATNTLPNAPMATNRPANVNTSITIHPQDAIDNPDRLITTLVPFLRSLPLDLLHRTLVEAGRLGFERGDIINQHGEATPIIEAEELTHACEQHLRLSRNARQLEIRRQALESATVSHFPWRNHDSPTVANFPSSSGEPKVQSTKGKTRTQIRRPRLTLDGCMQAGLARIGKDGDLELQCSKESRVERPKWRKLSDYPAEDPITRIQTRQCNICKAARGKRSKRPNAAPQDDESEEEDEIIPAPDYRPGQKRRRDDDDDEDRDERGKPANGRIPPFASSSAIIST